MAANLEKYGKFNEDGSEFIITNPDTPRPWINYLTNHDYCAIISQCAGGYSFYKDCRENRILRWQPANWHTDRPGRYVYITDADTGKYWSSSHHPVRGSFDFYQCRHGLGYTIIEYEKNKIRTRITYSVPDKDTCENWIVEIENKDSKNRNLRVFPYIEWLIGDYHQELRYRNIMNLYNYVNYDKTYDAVFAKKTAFWKDLNIQPFSDVLFFGSGLKTDGYFTVKDKFCGRYNTEEKPEAVTNDKIENTGLCFGEDAIGAFRHILGLKPGEKKEWTVVLGQTESMKKAAELLNKYKDVDSAKKEFEKTKEIWEKRIKDNITIKTPDTEFDKFVNNFLKMQVYICNYWSRSPSYYHEGTGGRGYRDSCQDAHAICSLNKDLTRERILTLARFTRKEGTTAPGWTSTSGPKMYRPNKDHPLWLVYTVEAYIEETGDVDILNQKMEYMVDCWKQAWFIDKEFKGPAVFEGKGSLYDHLWRNLEFTFNDIGNGGLPRIGHADWNDGIDAAGIRHKGGSVWLAMGLVRSLKALVRLAKLVNKKEDIKILEKRIKTMTERIEKTCWDGGWYTRGVADNGFVYGSKDNDEGKIYLNTQSWAILAEIPSEERRKKIFKSVDKYFGGEHGYALFYPGYTKYDSRLGRISMFAPGTKENAAVFCHAATFMVVAELKCGRGNKGYAAMRKIMPNLQKDYDLYKTEPYVYAEYIVGPEHPYLYGEGAFTWITGTAGWSYMAATQWVLGVRPDIKGLKIDPCLPSDWKTAGIRRPFRGDIYEITIENPSGVEKGVKEVTVDGNKIEGNIVVPAGDGKTHNVKVVMG
ncbi:MAG: hypothetical protein JW983_09155 [Elusimicrobia bacterium]|nr:hypothetical protein [Elusimicrobiota bacterium]